MAKNSARDLLRKAREQKKRQQTQNKPRPPPPHTNPTDDVPKPAKRPAAADPESISEMESEVKRLKVDANPEPQPIMSLVDYGSDSSDNEIESDSGEQMAEETGLPAGFFDPGVEPEEEEDEPEVDVQMDEPALPSGFFDDANEQKAAETNTSVGQVRVEQKKDLEKDLASFEAEIADLAEENEVVRTNDEADMQKSAIDELDRVDMEWKARTLRLAKMRAVIQQGLSEMDPEQVAGEGEVSSDSDSDSDMGDVNEIADWRSRAF